MHLTPLRCARGAADAHPVSQHGKSINAADEKRCSHEYSKSHWTTLDESGSNVSSLKSIFFDETGTIFREAVGQAFCFANDVVSVTRKAGFSHSGELWDQAVQRHLWKIIEDGEGEPCFVKGAELLIEKIRGKSVWEYGISIFEGEGATRFFNLPDGLIRTPTSIVALEFEHGKSIGEWGRQLAKAIRSAASSKIDGVLFCFYFKGKSAKSLFLGRKFTPEFQTLLGNAYNKKIGIVTIDQEELSIYPKPTYPEVADFVRNTYMKPEG